MRLVPLFFDQRKYMNLHLSQVALSIIHPLGKNCKGIHTSASMLHPRACAIFLSISAPGSLWPLS